MDQHTIKELIAKAREEYLFYRAEWKRTEDGSLERMMAYWAHVILFLQNELEGLEK